MEQVNKPQEKDLLMELMESLAELTQMEPKDEEAQIDRLKLFGIWYYTGFLVIFGTLALLANIWAPFAGMLFVVMVGAVIYISTGGNRYAKQYADAVKQKLIRQQFEQHFTKVRIHKDVGLPLEYAKEKDLLMFVPDHYRSNDFVSGCYHNVPFRRADVYAAMTEYSPKTKEKRTHLFEGRWLVLYFSEPMVKELIIKQKLFDAAIDHQKHQEEEKDCVSFLTQDKAFDEAFDVCTTDVAFASSFLDEAKRSTIKKYCDMSDGNVLLAYKGRELHVLIDSDENAMEPDPYSKDCESELISEIEKEISVIEKTVDMLLS